MKKVGNDLRLSASDLVGHLSCRHLTFLDQQAVTGVIERPAFHDPFLELLLKRGDLHEAAYVESLAKTGTRIVRIAGPGLTSEQIAQTRAAMEGGAEIIVQGALQDGVWGGRPDILRRMEVPSNLGAWSYEVMDTKLARETKGGVVLQLCLYSELLGQVQSLVPEFFYVVPPHTNFEPIRFRTSSYWAYFRLIKRNLQLSIERTTKPSTYPDPNNHCDICAWRMPCDARRRQDDHLCLVAGVSKIQIAELKRHSVPTLEALSKLATPLPWKPERGVVQSYERIREQARIQVAGRNANHIVFETLPYSPGSGLGRLPEPCSADMFFDIEGDPFVGTTGQEYLFGYAYADDDGKPTYQCGWALNREDELPRFVEFVDLVMERWAANPEMHIYHYAAYEPSTLKRLMGRYSVREDEIDRMLRGGLFVDLLTVVKQGIRASVESYSIKNLEPLYQFAREVELGTARAAITAIQASIELQGTENIDEETKRAVSAYNRDDCFSAWRLRDWLELQRAAMVASGTAIERPTVSDAAPSEELGERQKRVAELVVELLDGVPVDPTARTPEQHARWMLAYTLDWHRRENKSSWWEFFRLQDLSADDLLDERAAIGGLSFVESAGGTTKAPIHRYRFVPQDTDLRGGEKVHLPGGAPLGAIEDIQPAAYVVDLKKRQDTATVHPQAMFAHDLVSTDELANALLRIGEYVARNGIDEVGDFGPARALLLRQPPNVKSDQLRLDGESASSAAIRIAPMLTSGVLAIQGPPGAGKTFTAARMICALVKSGKRVGVTANSHKVIRHLLDKVVEAADETGIALECVQKVSEKQESLPRLRFAKTNEELAKALATQCQVAGGTAWLWARPDMHNSVDVLFVDEAAQMSLANVLAVSQACQAVVLLGDPQQLDQPVKGSHPDGIATSALSYVIAGKNTIDDRQGLFLDETWRLHPEICAFTSEQFYEGRLSSRAGLDLQVVKAGQRVSGAGLRFLPVVHSGNQSSSPEEAKAIVALYNEILASSAQWIDRNGDAQEIGAEQILIVAPYNAQVFEIQSRLPQARVGTVDKFQGQEAPIVIFSMTSSSQADAPRGMEFLYSPNRLNVATSRAMCVCILVGSPLLFEPECHTPRQMALANAFCRYRELALTI